MRRINVPHSTTLATLLALALAGPLGCSLGVNGGLSYRGKDEAANREYQALQARQAQAAALAEQESAVREQRVRFDGVNEPVAGGQGTAQWSGEPRTPADSATPRGTRFLLGELPTQSDGNDVTDNTPNFRQITFATEGADFDPAIDPSGQWLAFASTQQRVTSDLYIKAVDGSAVRQLTDDPANEATPVFSPDGKWIAYASDRAGNWDLYLISVDGGTSRQLTNSANHEIHPSFSPDGKRLVFCTRPAQSANWQLAVIDLDNPATQRFLGPGLFPHWSPKEDKIVFQRPRERGSRYFGVWTIELVNGEAMRPTLLAASANAAAVTPRWTADGQRIVFCTILNPDADVQQQGTPIRSDIWMINADGAGRVNLTRSQHANLQPAPAPDGSVYFVSNRGKNGTDSIWAIRTDTAVQVVRMRPEAATDQSAVAPTP